MLASHSAPSGRAPLHGGGRVSLAELRCRLESQSELPENCRQRLKLLARRLTRVQARGGKYSRVQLSEAATTAMERGALTV